MLSAAGVSFSKTDREENRTARRKKTEDSEARWLAAMPKSIRPLWEGVPKDGAPSSIKPLRDAVTGEFPDTRQRILTLFAWFGSGDGPWSDYPAYETIAGELLLDFSTPDLITAAQSENMTEPQLEGAARLFGGWHFSQRRPADLETLPPGLKKKLLDHSLQTTNEDRFGKAKHASASP